MSPGGEQAMNPDIRSAVSLIDHQIVELQKARKILLEIFGEKNTEDTGITKTTLPFPKQHVGTRRDAIIKVLEENGPLKRAEILQKTNFPLGTIATTLNDKTSFKNKNGRWHYIENKENSLEDKNKETP
jgi:hypothetical protein